MSPLAQIGTVLRKELLTEWRQRSRVSGILFFAFALILMMAFATPSPAVLERMAGGMLWLGLVLASTRSLDQSFTVEHEHGAMEGLVLWPVTPAAIYYGKALANAMVLLFVAILLTPLLLAVYNTGIEGSPYEYLAFLFFGCLALAAPATLLGQITVQARGSSVLLPLLLFPLVVPVIMAAGKGTSLVLEGDPMNQSNSWLMLLVAFDAVHWSLSGLLFARIVEDA